MAVSNWTIDNTHSSIEFSIRHMLIATVKGNFHQYEAQIEADPEDLTSAKINFAVDVASVDTRNEDRDNHLRSADFFDSENHPKMTFAAKKITKTGDSSYEITGDLTIRGTTREETFAATFEGGGKDPWGNERAGFSATGTINRSEYGLTWNAALETGGVLVGDDVKISIDLSAVKQA